MRSLKLAALAAAVLTGLGLTSLTAGAATTATTFTYAAGSPVLTVAPANPVPPVGTVVSIDLTARFIGQPLPAGGVYDDATVNAAVYPAVQELLLAGIPPADIAHAPLSGAQIAVAGTDTVITLFTVTAAATYFEAAATPGGPPVSAPAGYSGTETASWQSAAPLPAAPAAPHLYAGHVIAVTRNTAELGWAYGPGTSCTISRTFGYGFTVSGSPHAGFTCLNSSKAADLPDNDAGYWTGLAAGHTYDIELVPASPGRVPLPGGQAGWITVITAR